MNSFVGSTLKLDYTVTFRDAQDLELIRRKLVKALLILRSNADVGRSLMGYLRKLRQVADPGDTKSSKDLPEEYITSLEGYAKTVESLLNRLSGTSKLVCVFVPKTFLSFTFSRFSTSWSIDTTRQV